MAIKKKRKSVRHSHNLTFEVEGHSLSSGIGNGLGMEKFKDLSDSTQLWEATTYLKIWGTRLWGGEAQILDLTIYGRTEPSSLAETKGDYLAYEDSTEFGRRMPKTRVRNGYEEHVYRELKGIGYSHKGRSENNLIRWSTSFDHYPEYVSHILYLLSMDQKAIVSLPMESEGRHYWLRNFEITNDPYEVEDLRSYLMD